MRKLLSIPLIVLAAMVGAWACETDGGKSRQSDPDVLSVTRPLLLIEVPPYLEPDPNIVLVGSALTVSYRPASSFDPTVIMQEFDAPQLTIFPERPSWETTGDEGDEMDRLRFFAAWRCGGLGLSTLVTWKDDPGARTRGDVLDELAELLAEACANPSSVPTPSVEIDDPPAFPTCDPKEKDSVHILAIQNDTAEIITIRSWQESSNQVTERIELAPGESREFELDATTEAVGVDLSSPSDPASSSGYSFGAGTIGPDESVVVVGSPLGLRPGPGPVRVAGDCV